LQLLNRIEKVRNLAVSQQAELLVILLVVPVDGAPLLGAEAEPIRVAVQFAGSDRVRQHAHRALADSRLYMNEQNQYANQ
jgi:hypothetical protein